METPVRAISRVRPLLEGENNRTTNVNNSGGSNGGVVEVAPAASQIILGHDHFCDFDAVFGPDVSQKELYSACLEDLVTSFFKGYNVSVVGYGACQSGKTHTISGPGFLWAMNEEEFGLLPRSVRQLYRHLSENEGADITSLVSVSYLLLSAGAVYDLLASQTVLTPLPILADHKGSVMVPGLSSVECSSITEVLNCLEAGLLARHNHSSAHATASSADYSRVAGQEAGVSYGSTGPPHTHASFTITLQQRILDKEGQPRILCSRLNFVDLAGLDQQSPLLTHISQTNHSINTISNNLHNTLNVSSVSSVAVDVNTHQNSSHNSVSNNSYSHTEVLGEGVGACSAADDDDEGADNREYSYKLNQSQQGELQQQVAGDQEILQEASNIEGIGDECPEGPAEQALEEDIVAVEDGEEEDAALCRDNLENSSGSVVVSPDHQCLASVIACLVDRNYNGPIPYTHSMLTQLLKESLGGNCLTLVIVCASPVRRHLPATSLAMKYGGLARYIVNRPVVNELTMEQEQLLLNPVNSLPLPPEIPVNNSNSNPLNVNNNTANNMNTTTVSDASSVAGDNNDSRSQRMEAEEIFRLQFAGWQLQQLVEGADSLLRTSLPYLPPALQAQVGAWLCRRSEIIHCLGQQQSQSWPHQHRDDRTLHVIEEVSEPGDLKNSRTSCEETGTEDGRSTSSASSLGEEFFEQLAVLTSEFTDCTGRLVVQIQDKADGFTDQVTTTEPSSDDDALPQISCKSSDEDSSEEKMDSEREIVSDEAKDNPSSDTKFKKPSLKSRDKIITDGPIVIDNNKINGETILPHVVTDKKSKVSKDKIKSPIRSASIGRGSLTEDSDADMDTCDSDADDSSILSENDDNQQLSAPQPVSITNSTANSLGLVSAVALHVHEANRRRQRELRDTIREKESHLRTLQRGTREKEDLLKQNEARLVQLEGLVEKELLRLKESRQHAKTVRGDRVAEQEASIILQQHDRTLAQYRERIKAINSFISIIKATKTPPVEIATLSSRLTELRCELEEVETLVRVDDQRKQQLQNLRNNRPRKSDRQSADEDADDDNEDPDPLGPLQGASPPTASTVRRERVAVDGEERITLRRDRHPRSSSAASKPADHGLSQPHKRRLITSSSEQCSSDGEASGSRPERLLRAEIAHLRDARDVLTACRQRLNRKIQRDSRGAVLWSGERRLLELDEAVEAVDAAIEYKNELICGRCTELAASSRMLQQGKLLDRLLNLSMEEIRTLLVKYFNRVVDIRIEFRKQEIAYSELELQFEEQSRQLQRLEWSYQQASLDMERQCAVQHKQYLHHLHKLFRHIDTQETASLHQQQVYQQHHYNITTHATDGSGVVREMEMNLYYYKEQCSQLKSLIKQQQGQGYNFQPVYQQQLHQQQQTGEAAREHKRYDRRGISHKLSSLEPGLGRGSSSSTPHHYRNSHHQRDQPGPSVRVPDVSGRMTAVTVTAEVHNAAGSLRGTGGKNPIVVEGGSLGQERFVRASTTLGAVDAEPMIMSSNIRGVNNATNDQSNNNAINTNEGGESSNANPHQNSIQHKHHLHQSFANSTTANINKITNSNDDNRNHHLQGTNHDSSQSHGGRPRTTGPINNVVTSTTSNTNPFTRRSYLDPRPRRRPPASSSSRWRGLMTTGGGAHFGSSSPMTSGAGNTSGVSVTGDAIPLIAAGQSITRHQQASSSRAFFKRDSAPPR